MGQDRICAFCNKEIEDQALKAKNRLYHENTCFKCQICSKDLKNVAVFSKEDGVLYCEDDYKAKFVPKCAKCQDYIMEDCIKALDQKWHSNCFACEGCGLNFSDKDVGFHEYSNMPYCEKCYANIALPKCQGCQQPITDKTMKAMGGQWHISCFVCKDCKCTFEGQKSFYCIDDQPICGLCAGIGEEPDDDD